MSTFDIYTRVSDEDGRRGPSFGSREEQEATARRWAERECVEVGEVVYDGNVSGAAPVEERELGRLIRKVEAGESAGIVVRYIDRYARDMIEGAQALDRIVAAGGRLVAPDSGFDSEQLNADTRMTFNILQAVAQAQRERNRENRLQGIRRAAERGVYLASSPPAGYDRKDGKLSMQPKVKTLVRETFERRSSGESASSLAAWLHDAGADVETTDERSPSTRHPDGTKKTIHPFATITENGVRHILKNSAYKGEAVVQTGERGKPKVEAGGAWRVLTDEEWERAQAAGGPYHPNNGRWSSQVRLAGIVHCAEGHRMKVAGARSSGKAVGPAYTCTHPTCSSRTTIRASQLDEFAAGVLQDAVIADEPHVAAVLGGDDRYQTALNAVEFARTELDAFVETASVVDLGQDAWVRGKQARQAALEAARAAVKAIPPTTKAYSRPLPISQKRWAALSVEERREIVEAAMDRDAHAKFIARIEVQKVGQGRKVAPAERVSIWFVGAEESADLTAYMEVRGGRPNPIAGQLRAGPEEDRGPLPERLRPGEPHAQAAARPPARMDQI